MLAKLVPAEGINDGGSLYLKGPNVMLGYIKPENPGVIEPVPDGWHDSGDIASIDEDGVITIKGRLKRFAKVGGESVSLTIAENCAAALWPDHRHASVAIPNERKGEQIVLLTTNPEAKRSDLITWAQANGIAEIALPRRIFYTDEIPLLGTGKPHYRGVDAIIRAQIQAS
jgi:acyl-[acyl-carrier-protein]-phospholipid O-acyltransferase/long-chain-fatty-acid--[acyl-carrier-protein] ligase